MALAIKVIEQINEQLMCAICLERLTSPLFLQCLHTFCSQCLHRIVNNDPTPIITCPTCRAETQLPEKGVDYLMPNFFVTQMLDLVQQKSEELKKEIRENKKCTACDNTKTADIATSRCIDCSMGTRRLKYYFSRLRRSWRRSRCTSRVRVGCGAATSGEAARNSISNASSPLPFFGSRLRHQNFNHTIPPAAQATASEAP